MAERPRESERTLAAVAVALGAVGGYVDALGFLLLYQLFAANMSGNSILLGISLGRGQWSVALHQFLPIPLFVAGVALGAALGELLARRGVRRTMAVLLALELTLLAGFLVLTRPLVQSGTIAVTDDLRLAWFTALLTVPMGIQNAAMRRVGAVAVRTTFVTGTLTSWAEATVSRAIAPTTPRASGEPGPAAGEAAAHGPDTVRPGRLLGALWLAYVVGAALGAWAVGRWAVDALALPLALLASLIVWDARGARQRQE
jgi:uncharacterized membrane protein YoaK (UPF0700 family)